MSDTLDQMKAEMRARRAGPLPPTPPFTMSPERAALLGCDTPEGRARFQRLDAWRTAGYTGPLDDNGDIPDPDDPAEQWGLSTLAALRDTRQEAAPPAGPDAWSLPHSLEMWCDDPDCGQCAEGGDGECLQAPEPVNAQCLCGRWTARGDELEVLGWYNAHTRDSDRKARARQEMAAVVSGPAERAAVSPVEGRNPAGGLLHIVGWLERLKSAAGRRAPRSMCGVPLTGDPDDPGLPEDAPICPACIERGHAPSVLLRRLWWVPDMG
jgi:hypothetical protein